MCRGPVRCGQQWKGERCEWRERTHEGCAGAGEIAEIDEEGGESVGRDARAQRGEQNVRRSRAIDRGGDGYR